METQEGCSAMRGCISEAHLIDDLEWTTKARELLVWNGASIKTRYLSKCTRSK